MLDTFPATVAYVKAAGRPVAYTTRVSGGGSVLDRQWVGLATWVWFCLA